eukprot:Pompholyxophrys_punicea_v1_NODE_587_length_1640_cov_6.484868.p2 type:complete len:154 gc:universal NODE_587_length_1640_cov_6.484868:794-1255(+)
MNLLRPNVQKSSSLLFVSSALQRRHSYTLPEIPFQGTSLFAGIPMHIESLCKKIAGFSCLFRLLRSTLPTPALLALYNALVLPHLCYGIELWGSSNSSTSCLRPLFLLQKRIVRHIAHAPFLAHTAPIFASLRILDIFSLHRLRVLLLAFKLS